MKLSLLSETMIGSEIVKLGGQIREKIAKGEKIYNFTVGDFDPSIFPIPKALEDEIVNAYRNHCTNYPPAEGILELRKSVSTFMNEWLGLDYGVHEILISSGGRPLIYSLFRAICDKGDKVIYAVPSWNNNHYTHFVEGQHVVIEVKAENNFMITADEIRPFVKEATLISLCSPQNPTGTTFKKEELEKICDLVLEENQRRGDSDKKLFVMYDQMYFQLTYGDIKHYDPVSLSPAMREYTIFIDAISKVFAATGVRVGWAIGPEVIIAKMKALLTHVGAWAPMAEQKAVSVFLGKSKEVSEFLVHFKKEILERLEAIYKGLMNLKEEGFNIDAISPEAAIYLTIKIDLVGKKSNDGINLKSQEDVTDYILNKAGLAVVPFSSFGASRNSAWYRLSIGTCKKEKIDIMLGKLKTALQHLS